MTTMNNNSNNGGYKSNGDKDCSICLSTIQNETEISDCKHKFCRECIENWVLNQIKCPLCKRDIKELVVVGSGQSIKVNEPKKPPPSEVEVDLACLDHKYFLEEVNKLLSLCEIIKLQLENIPTPSHSSSKVYVNHSMTLEDTKALESVQERLVVLQKELESYENTFDAQAILSELYMYSTIVNELKDIYIPSYDNANTPSQKLNTFKQNQRFHFGVEEEDDYYEYDDDDDYEYDNHQYAQDRFLQDTQLRSSKGSFDTQTNNNKKKLNK
ncbi:hypothetical protein DLAC_05803 [Tieghemostelium lacteum]|uniref:RING-type domain-containing protein n=1 Tax=Tieghemostelium lacteum TaxID=361077 RepID=A0A151ZGY5_TIELA|nr:hypothetical protein DLAC_05803 [Tieghemostelium lacteum]|eukprot:KYQ93169.1 hypothetical protein DLAC_05803 [Tieghemostelium lacteum]